MNNIEKRIERLEQVKDIGRAPQIIVYNLVEVAWAEGGHKYTQEEEDAFFGPMIAKKPGKQFYCGFWDGFKFREMGGHQ